VWVAQRIPEDHVTVVANLFVIRTVDFDDHENFMYSSNIKDVAKRNNWWESGDFDFTLIYSSGEYAHK